MPDSVAQVPDIQPAAVVSFWFLANDSREMAPASELNKRWFGSGDSLDSVIRERFGMALEKAVAGGLKDWESESESRLALIVLLDQFTRQAWRGSVRAFVGDQRALALTKSGLKRGYFDELPMMMQVAALMPFQHSESLADQEESLERFEALALKYPEESELMQGYMRFAKLHRDIVAQFGRFPHRNQVMGRASTEAELAFLEDGPRFGQ